MSNVPPNAESVESTTYTTTKRVVDGNKSKDNFLKFDYKTPQEELNRALNFEDDEGPSTVPSASKTNIKSTLTNILKKMNNNEYIYPGLSIISLLILVIMVLFQKPISILIKILAVLIFLVFLVYSIYQFKFNPNI